jgi:hypothetical protein
MNIDIDKYNIPLKNLSKKLIKAKKVKYSDKHTN